MSDFYDVINREVTRIEDIPLDLKKRVNDIQDDMIAYHDDVERYNGYRCVTSSYQTETKQYHFVYI